MPRAAVPDYLGRHLDQHLKRSSPGLRFGMYLPVWTTRLDQERTVDSMASRRSREAMDVARTRDQQGMDVAIDRHVKEKRWDKNDHAAHRAWRQIVGLNENDRERMSALARRQSSLISTLPAADRFTIDAVGIAPLVTGMGNEHPLENGFAFLDPHGLPYLPASGVKGVLRTAGEELASGDWGDPAGWDQRLTVTLDRKTHDLRIIDLLFGHDPVDGQRPDAQLFRGLLHFWDVVPQIQGNRLMVEIMTPHQGDYYRGTATPHDSGQPVPITFLAVPPGSGYTFHATIDQPRLTRLGLADTLTPNWQTMLEAAFHHAFEWIGFGAKTALGYGAMLPDDNAAREREQTQRELDQARREAALSPEERIIARFRADTEQARKAEYRPGQTYDQQRNEFIKTVTEWTNPELRTAAAAALDESFSNKWGASSKKKKELQKIVAQLRGE